MDKSDEDIMMEYTKGNQQVIGVIFSRYKSRILNFSLRILGNRADAEDVTGEVFLTLFSGKYTFDPKAKFSTWLFTVARNSCLSRIRKQKRMVSMWFSSKDASREFTWEIKDDADKPNDLLAKKESVIQVRQAIAKLVVEQREAIVLREYDRFSYAQISQILDCSLEKVKILIFRARESIRDDLSSLIREES